MQRAQTQAKSEQQQLRTQAEEREFQLQLELKKSATSVLGLQSDLQASQRLQAQIRALETALRASDSEWSRREERLNRLEEEFTRFKRTVSASIEESRVAEKAELRGFLKDSKKAREEMLNWGQRFDALG